MESDPNPRELFTVLWENGWIRFHKNGLDKFPKLGC